MFNKESNKFDQSQTKKITNFFHLVATLGAYILLCRILMLFPSHLGHLLLY